MTAKELREIWVVKDLDESTVSIHGYKGNDINLEIPDYIGSKAVVAIGHRAFRPASHKERRAAYRAIETIKLPSTLLRIGEMAFDGCKGLKEIIIPDKVETILDGAFMGCKKLNKVVLSKSLHYVGISLFRDCTLLEEVIIPASLEQLSQDMFYNCKKLKRCIFESQETTVNRSSFFFCDGLEELLTITAPGKHEPYKVAPAWYVLCGCTALKSVELNPLAQCICDGALNGCENLKEIHIPPDVRIIGHNAFRDCNKVEYINIPESVETVEYWSFWHMTALKRVDFQSQHTEIEDDTFRGCENFVMGVKHDSRPEEFAKKYSIKIEYLD